MAETDYLAYGLRFRSPLVLPFRAVAPGAAPDVTVRVGPVPAALPAPARRSALWETAPGAFLLGVEGVARYLVTDGRDILVEPAAGVRDHDVSVFLVGSVLGALLQQRGVLPLHASAVSTDDGAVLFLGSSGAGKSALLAALSARGYAMLADDVTGVVLDADGRPTALSAASNARLWADTLDALGWRERVSARVRNEIEKYVVSVARFRRDPQAVCAAYVLLGHNRDSIEIAPVGAAGAFRRYLQYTYRARFARGMGRQAAHFHLVAALAQQVPVATVIRPVHPLRLDALAARIEAHAPAMQPAAGGG